MLDAKNFPKRALDLITRDEGLDDVDWPGGASGVTIGRGYDLGYHSPAGIRADWGGLLSADDVSKLCGCAGITGEAAKESARLLHGQIHIPIEAADFVLRETSIPQAILETHSAFPGFDSLPVDAQGSLVSLVYNRGTSFGIEGEPSWDTRREMRAVRDAVAKGDLQEIAKQIRSMSRLWEGKGLDGLLTRREEEAKLVEASIPVVGIGGRSEISPEMAAIAKANSAAAEDLVSKKRSG
jgi:GH24 family phage-related lysozyme (muramidase)